MGCGQAGGEEKGGAVEGLLPQIGHGEDLAGNDALELRIADEVQALQRHELAQLLRDPP